MLQSRNRENIRNRWCRVWKREKKELLCTKAEEKEWGNCDGTE